MTLRWWILGLQYELQGAPAMRRWREFERLQWLPPQEFRSHCAQKLGQTLAYAAQQVPWYRDQACSHEIDSFPVTTRLGLIEHYESLKSDQAGQPGEYVAMSSGSTGRQVSVLCDMQERAARAAVTWRGDAFPGRPGVRLAPGCRTVALWGFSSLALDRQSLRRRIATWAQNKLYFDCLVMTPQKARFVHRQLQRLRPRRIAGYVHALALFSRFCLDMGLPRIQADKLIPSAEWLDPESRALIEQVFDAPLRERYGCREAGDIAHQCEYGNWHVNADHVHLEVLRPDGSITTEGSGRLLVTKLNNRAMPLVRYDIEDQASLGGGTCRCGRALPLMSELSGRVSSHFVLPDGTLLSQFAATIPFHNLPVREWQARQETAREVRFMLVPGPGFEPAMLEHIKAKFEPYHSGQLTVSVEVVGDIPLAPSGKRVLVYNELLGH